MKKLFNQITKSILVVFLAISPALAGAQTINEVIETFNAGAELINGGNFEEAIVKFEECIQLAEQLGAEGDEMKQKASSQIPALHYRMATTAYKEKDIPGAIEKFEATVEACNTYGNDDLKAKSLRYIPALYYSKGSNHLKNNEFEEALTSFDMALESNPNYARALYGKGLVYRKQDNDEKMVELFNKAIETGKAENDSKTAAAASKIMRDHYFGKAADALKAEDNETAFSMFDESLQYDPEFADPYYYKAVIYNKQLEYDLALENAEKALELETDEEQKPRIYFELGNAYVGNVDYEKACEAYSKCLVEPFEKSARHKMENVLNCQ